MALRPVSVRLAEIGKTRCTFWRWQKLGWIKVVNICGKLYVADSESERFILRAQAGEFSQTPIVPHRGHAEGKQ